MKVKNNKTLVYVIGICPEYCKSDKEKENFYGEFQDVLDTIPKHELIIIMIHLNAKIGDTVTPEATENFNETVHNVNGELMVSFESINELRINNTYWTIRSNITTPLITQEAIGQ